MADSYINDFWSQDKNPYTMTNTSAAPAPASNQTVPTSNASSGSGWGVRDIIGAAGDVTNIIGGLFKSSPEQNGALPFEIEKQMVMDSTNNITNIQNNMAQAQKVYEASAKQLSILQKIASSSLPSAADMKALQNSNIDIAKAFGNSTLAAIQSGFLDEDTARLSGMIEGDTNNLRDKFGELMQSDFRDPNLENQRMNDRRKLEQQLARDGVPMQQRSQALAQFDQQTQNQRFSRAEELRSTRIDQLSSIANTTNQGYKDTFGVLQQGKNQSFQQAVQGFGQLQAGFQQGQNAINQSADITNATFNMNQQFNSGQIAGAAATSNIYGDMAQTPLSLRTRGALGDKVSYGHGFLGLKKSDPAKDAASQDFRKQYQSSKARRFASL